MNKELIILHILTISDTLIFRIIVLPVAAERTRYYQESREGIYTGPLFIFANFLQGLPLSAFTTLLATFITFR